MFAQRFVTLFVKKMKTTTPYKNVVTQTQQNDKNINDKNMGDWYEVSFR